jgi:hypothetical protein
MNTHQLRVHWFLFVAPLILGADLYCGLSLRGEIDRVIEGGLLFDLSVLLPGLYWLCYRNRGRRAVFGAVAMACSGVWVASKIVPEVERDLLNYFVPLRYVGIAVIVWLEVAIVFTIYRAIFKGGTVDQAISQAPADLPPWVSKLLAMEANFWLKVWNSVRRFFGAK